MMETFERALFRKYSDLFPNMVFHDDQPMNVGLSMNITHHDFSAECQAASASLSKENEEVTALFKGIHRDYLKYESEQEKKGDQKEKEKEYESVLRPQGGNDAILKFHKNLRELMLGSGSERVAELELVTNAAQAKMDTDDVPFAGLRLSDAPDEGTRH